MDVCHSWRSIIFWVVLSLSELVFPYYYLYDQWLQVHFLQKGLTALKALGLPGGTAPVRSMMSHLYSLCGNCFIWSFSKVSRKTWGASSRLISSCMWQTAASLGVSVRDNSSSFYLDTLSNVHDWKVAWLGGGSVPACKHAVPPACEKYYQVSPLFV